MGLTKEQVKTITEELKQAVQEIGKKHCMDITFGNVKYSALQFDTKMTAKLLEVNGKSVEQIEFEKYCFAYGFNPDDYGAVADRPISGHLFKLIGFNLSKPKYVLKCKDVMTEMEYNLPDNARNREMFSKKGEKSHE